MSGRLAVVVLRLAVLGTSVLGGAPRLWAYCDVRSDGRAGSNTPANTHASWSAGGGAFSGLYHIPSAYTIPNGLVRFGVADDRYRRVTYPSQWRSRRLFCAELGFLPGIEIGAAVVDMPANLRGTFDDRLFSAKWRLVDLGGAAIAVGSTDIEGTRVAGSEYAVLSLSGGGFSGHLGAGRGALKGLFGGAEAHLGRNIRLFLEHDSRDVNAGLGWKIDDRWQLALALPELKTARFSLSCTLPATSRNWIPPAMSQPAKAAGGVATGDLDALASALGAEGFEDVQTNLEAGELVVRAESRVFLNPEYALTAMRDLAFRFRPPNTDSIVIVLRRGQVDVVTVRWHAGSADGSAPAFQTATTDTRADGLGPSRFRSEHHVDVTVAPKVSASFGATRVPWRLALEGDSEVRAGSGWSLHTKVEGIVTDTIDHRTGSSLRNIAIAHTSQPAPRTWLRLQAGRPPHHALGLQGQVLWQDARGMLAIEGHATWFSFKARREGTWSAGVKLSTPSLLHGVVVGCGADRFAAGDVGVTLDVLRRMGETETTLFAIRTARRGVRSWILGGRISVPLGPSKTSWDRSVRVRPHDRFGLEYRTRTGALPEEGLAEHLGLGPSLFDDLLDRGRLMPESLRRRFATSPP